MEAFTSITKFAVISQKREFQNIVMSSRNTPTFKFKTISLQRVIGNLYIFYNILETYDVSMGSFIIDQTTARVSTPDRNFV